VVRTSVALLIAIVSAAACASQPAGRTALPDGSFKIECRKGLAACLTDLTKDICQEYGYEVLKGQEVVKRYGVEPVNSVLVTSDAVVRCRSPAALIGGTPAPTPTASGARAPSGCFPGATQACLGPGACKGAQTCRDDGTSFGPCDCGGAPAVGGGVTSTPPAPSAAPPSTWATPGPDGGAAP
jgi:hypothetical protein